MTLVPYKVSRSTPVSLFALLVSSLLVFQPRPQPIAASNEHSGPAAEAFTSPAAPTHSRSERRPTRPFVRYAKNTIQLRLPRLPPRVEVKKKQTNVAKILSKLGPVFPETAFSMSNFSVDGFVKGEWPIVVEYELEADSIAELTISATNNGKLETFRIPLPSTNGERRQVEDRLPGGFGQKPQPGVLSFKALKNGPDPRKPARFFLYGLGVGDKAVGSIVIVQQQFWPPSIRPKLKQKASYSFQSLSDFNSGSADFMLVTRPADGVIHMQLAARKKLDDGVERGKKVQNDWDGKNDKGKISSGPHHFLVRVWRSLKSSGDWVSTFSKEVVKVE